MAYIPSSGSVVAFQSNADNLKASIQGTVGASIIGQAPVNVVNTNLNIGGSVVSFQGTNPFIITGSVQTTVTTGNSSVQVLNFPTTQNVSGSVIAFQSGTVISSISGVPNIQGKDAPLASITGNPVYISGKDANGSVAGIQILAGALLTVGSVSGSVGIVGNPSVSGTVATTQQGAWTTSLVSTIPSSVIVGASIFGQLPAGTAPLGSVAVLQGTNPFIITGSVQGFPLITSVLSVIAPSTAVTSIKTATSVTTLITSNTARRGVAISNNSATSILVKLGGMNTVNDYSLVMFVNDYYEVPFNYSGAVSHYASSVAGLVYITEIT